jgi:hypothetical protein
VVVRVRVLEDAEQAQQTGGMVALLPADPAPLVIPDGEPADEQHITLLYLGQDVTGWDATRRQHVLDAARAAAEVVGGPIAAAVTGHATFSPTSDEPVAVHLVSGAGLADVHDAAVAGIAEVLGDDLHPQHSPWVAHATGRYGGTAAELSYAGPVVLDRMVVVLAGERVEIPLGDPIARIALEAYAHGWALTGGPWTPRVSAGARVAVEFLRENAEHPDALAATIQLGSLEGTLAELFDRREQLIAGWIPEVAAAVRRLLAVKVGRAGTVQLLRRAAGLSEATSTNDDNEARAKAQAQNVLHQAADPTAPEYQQAVSTIASALRDAAAEGQAGAVAVAAEQGGRVEIRFDLAFEDARTALGDLDVYWGDAAGWLGKVLNGAAADLGDALVGVLRAGGDWEDMVSAASTVLDEGSVRAVDTLIDMAMSQSYSRGALDLYGREGVATVDYVTAGGARVCPICLDHETNNPWPRTAVPQPAVHPYCRCVLMPSDPLEALRSLDLDRYSTSSSGGKESR